MPKTRVQKTETLAKLTDAFKKGKSVAFADYQGMTVQKVTTLRKQLHAAQVEYVVAKKTLLSLAAKEAGYDVNVKGFPGMMSVAFAMDDEMAGVKTIGDASKDATIKLVGGIFDGVVIDQAQTIALSKLPTKSQLLGQLLSVLNGPASAFVRLLNAYQEKMGSGSTAAPVEASKAEETSASVEATEAPSVAEAPAAEAPTEPTAA